MSQLLKNKSIKIWNAMILSKEAKLTHHIHMMYDIDNVPTQIFFILIFSCEKIILSIYGSYIDLSHIFSTIDSTARS